MKRAIDIIIQARMGSTRLPGKVLLPFAGVSVLEYIVESARASSRVGNVIVATTINPKDDAIEELCKKRLYIYSRGSEQDVLGRYYEAARRFASEIIGRVTSDNIFTDMIEMSRLVDILINENLDYVSNHRSGMPVGTGSEVFTFHALEAAHHDAKLDYEREHVTPYFYKHSELFKQKDVAPLKSYNADGIRLTLDTEEDYQMFKKIESVFFRDNRGEIILEKIIEFLRNNSR